MLVVGGGWMIAVFIAALIEPVWLGGVAETQAAWTYREHLYERAMLGLFGSILATPAGLIVGLATAVIARRRARPAT
jgi:hypothetical protein